MNFGVGLNLPGAISDFAAPLGLGFRSNMPLADPLWSHTSRTYPGYNPEISDQDRASRFIQEIQQRYLNKAEPLPRFMTVYLPNDRQVVPQPEKGYPYDASVVADNDYAVGRIVEFLSHSNWWRNMAVFITEDDATGGVDHIHGQRTILLVASPYAKRNYASHINVSHPGLLKTIFRLLGVPPLNLFDATASDLSDCFTSHPNMAAYQAIAPDRRVFDPASVGGGCR